MTYSSWEQRRMYEEEEEEDEGIADLDPCGYEEETDKENEHTRRQ